MVQVMEAFLDTMERAGTSSVRLKSAEEARYYRPQLRFLLDSSKALFEPVFKTDDILGHIESDLYQLWVGGDDTRPDMFALTEVAESPRVKVVTVVWCCGQNMGAYFNKFMCGVEAYASIIKADIIQVTGRKGWERLLEPHGYTFSQIIMSKRVEDDSEDAE